MNGIGYTYHLFRPPLWRMTHPLNFLYSWGHKATPERPEMFVHLSGEGVISLAPVTYDLN